MFLLAALALGGCGQQGPSPTRDPAPQARAVASGLDATARAFVELTIATDDQALKLLDLGASRAASPGLRAFAGSLATDRRTELSELHALLGSTPYVNNHEGHDMPGMPTEAELIALPAAPDFDTEFVRLTRAHLTESTTVAKSGADNVRDEPTKALATRMLQERGEALQELDTLPR
ncbi:DUF305 domain-containing protein [Actinophytocola oryzae]|uniref:Uncharacterized protein (DUF305 family) n=1 Tax=Actinophytocola oryzae TaxID=502181 RepID=A0A4R7VRK7_9PSEU|nr:DUF305 domain-containing protein [Actinophytocola oryzae]TDV52118.1 uncharacterized protein (DUF305 family) [Actinophytocola oryzae]